MKGGRLNDFPIEQHHNLVKVTTPIRDNVSHYRRLVGLLYLTIIRPDIQYPKKIACQVLEQPCQEHYDAVKRIIRNIKRAP
ncbi:Uncharacterized mitochondrial protein AtMg00810 [Linum grandiflorum]